MQRDAKSRGHLAEFHDGSAEAPHTEAYLFPQIVTLCAELGVRCVIDIGCCNGALCRELASRGYQVVGCVPARTVFGSHKIRHQSWCLSDRVDYDPSAVGADSFDVAIATEVIEHLVRPHNLPGFAKQLLRPGGHLIISTPYHGYLKNPFIALSNKWDSHLSPPWDGGHIKLWSRKVSASFASSERVECLSSERA